MVNSFIEYWQEIKKLCPRDSEDVLFLRGQSNADFSRALPGICRSGNICENDEYHQIMIDYPEEFKKNDHLSNLVKMQHFGCNTRLLDFSLNPLIALYFATEFDREKNAKIFVARVPKKNILFFDSDKAIMLACLPKFSKKDQNEILNFCKNHPGRITEQDVASDSVINRFLHEVRAELPAFKTEIVGEDLLRYYYLCPQKDNERMKAQEGAFAIFGLGESALTEQLNRELTVIEIAARAKPDIQKDLALMRITTSTIYPGVERRAMINRGKVANWVPKI